MSDLALIWSPQAWSADLALNGADLMTEEGLATAVIISLFTDRRAREDDELPAAGDRRGWWGDAFADIANDQLGSRLWLLERSKALPDVVARAQEYAEEALQWLVDDKVAENVTVAVSDAGQGWLKFAVAITRPEEKNAQFDYVWKAIA